MKFLSDDEMDSVDSASPRFVSDDEMDAMESGSVPSELESGLRGAAQGASFGFADELTGAGEAALGKLSGDEQSFLDLYRKHRDESRKNYKGAEEANPATYMTGQVGGAIAPALLTGGASAGASGAGLAARLTGSGLADLAAQGAVQGLGSSEADLTRGNFAGAAEDTGLGLATGAAFGAGGNIIKNVAGKIPGRKLAESTGNYLKEGAEKLAEKATGATGRESERFVEGTGRELLDRGLVAFGDTPETIAEKAAAAQRKAGAGIGGALSELDKRGVTASIDNVVIALEGQIADLKQTPGNEKLIRELSNEIDNLFRRGESDLPISMGEQAKRNYQGQVNYNSPNAEKDATTRIASAFQKEVEGAATAADPSVAGKFKEDKELFGLLAPVRNAAERRAAQLNQSPFGGFGDLAAGGMGSVAGGPAAVGAIASRRFLAPRAASSLAVGADKIGDLVKQSPQAFGKYAPVLMNAAQRGGNALAASHYVMQQTDPEYRKVLQSNGLLGGED